MAKFLTLLNGFRAWVNTISVSLGVIDADKIVATNSNGKLDSSLLPVNNAYVDDITDTKQYGKFTGLKSNYYLLGADLGITPVVAGQSGISSYWGLQIGGLRGDLLYSPTFAPIDPPSLTNKETVGSFCVAIFPGNTNFTEAYPTSFNSLAVYQSSWQTGGNFIACKNNSNVNIFNVDLNGNIFINNTKVLGSRETGWTASTGTALKSVFATDSATLIQCAQRIKALEDTLRTHGLIN
jgi:hypothetical protein